MFIFRLVPNFRLITLYMFIFIGAFLGLFVNLLAKAGIADWKGEEHFPPTMFFLILLPPIIFESGYNLHKVKFIWCLCLTSIYKSVLFKFSLILPFKFIIKKRILLY